ncbi:MAG: hypothetical protein IT330_00735 [Anaerolineae bacterium]|nr:hypothetical protein [Anaerolineae bacterium]
MSNQAHRAAALEECLEALKAGESLAACLARHPGQTEALRPLLATIAGIERLGSVPSPRPAEGAARGRAEFLVAVTQRRRAQEQRRQRRYSFRHLFSWGAGWATAAAALVLVVILATGSVAASAGALPGDVLYPVKRATEQVQVFFSFNPAARDALREQLDERRRQEVLQVLEAGRIARTLTFVGFIESISPSLWEINGLPVQIQSITRVEGQPRVGDQVQVSATAPGDGTLLALRIRSLGAGTPLRPTATATPGPTPTPEASATPTLATSPGPTPLPATPAVRLDTPTAPMEPTATPSPTATHTPTATVSPTPTSTPTATPTATPTWTATPQPPTRVVSVRFEGTLREKVAGRWIVGSRTVLLPGGTPIDETRGAATVGAWVQVSGVEQPDGAIVAQSIVVLTPAEAPGEPYEFTDVIEAIGGDVWTIGGVQVHIAPGATIDGATPAVGRLAHVKAMRRPNGEIWATHITVEEPGVEEIDTATPTASPAPSSTVTATPVATLSPTATAASGSALSPSPTPTLPPTL